MSSLNLTPTPTPSPSPAPASTPVPLRLETAKIRLFYRVIGVAGAYTVEQRFDGRTSWYPCAGPYRFRAVAWFVYQYNRYFHRYVGGKRYVAGAAGVIWEEVA